MPVTIVIGKNFGDEGKGLAADFFASRSQKAGRTAVCVRHNGGAQAGHTVDMKDGRRFVFSQLSSASFRGADTYWADSFLPDLYKLPEETERFRCAGGTVPQIYASPRCRCTYIGDILLNMLLETGRGADRHGSCGMGINEAVVRSESFPLSLGDIAGIGADALYHKMRHLQKEYLPQRLAELQINLDAAGEYGELLQSDAVLRNAAGIMAQSAELVQLRDASLLKGYGDVIFEGAQGLLLDELYLRFAPHLTSSRTGLFEPARILRGLYGNHLPAAEIVYVSRTYVTRHGAGPLPHEDFQSLRQFTENDRTNVPNAWQGTLRSAPHGCLSEFTEAVRDDLSENDRPAAASLFLTHLNETNGCIVTTDGQIPAEAYLRADEIRSVFGSAYLSDTPFSEDIRKF